jgi:hypothetical protein
MVNIMAKEEVFNAATSAMSFYGGLFKAIMEEQGLEKALELHAKQFESMGNAIGEQLKQALGDKDPDMKVLRSILEPMYESFGFSSEFEVDPTTITITQTKCPLYAGYQMAGLDPQTIEKVCKAAAKAEFDAINQHYPQLYFSAQPPESPDGICIEKFNIKK